MMRSTRPTSALTALAVALVLSLAVPQSAQAVTPTPTATASATPTPSPTPTVPAATTFRNPLAAKSYSVSYYHGARCILMPGASTFHLGVDLAAKGGAPISAIAAGVVTATISGTASRAGYITIKHTIGGVAYTSMYYHIWSATTRVKVGQVVTAGQRISEVGSSGVSSGNHLHLEVWKGGTAVDPLPFLKTRGVDIKASATAVTASAAPASCTYYATGALNFRTGPSTSYGIIRELPKGTAMVHVPGKITSGFIPVRIGTVSGWVSSSYVTPIKPAAVKTTAAPATASLSVAKPATYKAKAAVNFRKTASMSGKKIRVIPKGANVGKIKATKGVWKKVTYKGKTGWVHSKYLKKR